MPQDDPDFKDIFLNVAVPLAVLDSDYRVVAANPAYCQTVRSTPDVLIGAKLFELYPEKPERIQTFVRVFDRAIEGQPQTLAEVHYPIRDPSSPDDPRDDKWWSINCQPLPEHPIHGPVFVVQLQDVTDEVRHRETSDVYAAELRHRIGNILTLVKILARKSGQTASDVTGFLDKFEQRISALGQTHAFLSGDNWDGMTLRQIVEQQLRVSGLPRQEAIEISGPEWNLSVLHAQSFAMAIHELKMNSLQAGVLGAETGKLTVRWDVLADGSYTFLWRETGLARPTEPQVSGFGTEMLMHLLPGQLAGKAVKSHRPDGFQYTLVISAGVEVPVGQKRRGR